MPEDSEPVFIEKGASWWWLMAGPAAGLAMVLIQFRAGLGFRPIVPLIFLAMMSLFLAVQIKAARIHTSVELTRDTLRQGQEEIPVGDILAVFPEPDHTAKDPGFMDKWQGRALGVRSSGNLERWQSAQTLGEISGLPRRRTGIGLQLTNKRLVQAWARDDEKLRAALTRLLEDR